MVKSGKSLVCDRREKNICERENIYGFAIWVNKLLHKNNKKLWWTEKQIKEAHCYNIPLKMASYNTVLNIKQNPWKIGTTSMTTNSKTQ